MVIASRTSRVVVAAAEPVFLGIGKGFVTPFDASICGFVASGLTPKKWAKRMSFHTPSGTLTRNVQAKVIASEREGWVCFVTVSVVFATAYVAA